MPAASLWMQVGAGSARVEHGAAAASKVRPSAYERPELRENQPRETLRAVSPHLIRRGVAPCASGQGGTRTLAPWLIIAIGARVLETRCDGHHDELPELMDAHDRYLYGRHTCTESSLGCDSLIRLLAMIFVTYNSNTRFPSLSIEAQKSWVLCFLGFAIALS